MESRLVGGQDGAGKTKGVVGVIWVRDETWEAEGMVYRLKKFSQGRTGLVNDWPWRVKGKGEGHSPDSFQGD